MRLPQCPGGVPVLAAFLALAYALAYACFQALGCWNTSIPWAWYQFLDDRELFAHPFASLFYLHGQPPLMNALCAVILRVAHILGTHSDVLAWGATMALGLLSVAMLAYLVWRVSASKLLAGLIPLLLVFHPAFHCRASLFTYDFLLMPLLLLLAVVSCRALWQPGSPRLLPAVALLLVCVVNTRSLFHPVWACAFFAGILFAGRYVHPGERPTRRALIMAVLILAVGLSAWPIKNYLVFGQYTFSSWTGYNLARSTPIRHPVLETFNLSRKPELPPEIEAAGKSFEPVLGVKPVNVVKNPVKSNGYPNWNHLSFLLLCPELGREAVQWRRDHPAEALKAVLRNYLIWCRPMYRQTAARRCLGPENRTYQALCEAIQRYSNPNLRPWLETATPDWGIHSATRHRDVPLDYSLYGLVLYPMMLLVLIAIMVKRIPQRRPVEWVVLLCLGCELFAGAVTWLTDGLEGGRLAFPTYALVLVCWAYVIAELGAAIGNRVQAWASRLLYSPVEASLDGDT